MRTFFLIKLGLGTLIGIAAFAVIAGLVLLARPMVADPEVSSVPYVIYTLGTAATILVTFTFLVTFLPPNLAWLMTLPVSKTRIWLTHLASSWAVALAASAGLAGAALVADRVFPKTELFSGWEAIGRSLVALILQGIAPLKVQSTAAVGALLYVGLVQFLAGMVDLKPGRAARWTVFYVVVWGTVLTLASIQTESPALFALLAVLAGFSFQAGHTRARLAMTWGQFKIIGGLMVAGFVLLGVVPLVATVRAQRGDTVVVVRDADEMLGNLARLDPDHLVRLMHARHASGWDFRWLVWQLDIADNLRDDRGSPYDGARFDPTDRRVDFRQLVAAQDRLEVFEAIAAMLSRTSSMRDLELVIDRAGSVPDPTSDVDDNNPVLQFAATALELEGVEDAVDRLLAAEGARQRAVGLVLARYYPSAERLTRAKQLVPSLPQGLRAAGLATISLMAGRLVGESEVAAADVAYRPVDPDLCRGLTQAALCKIKSDCQSTACVIRAVGSEARLNLCLRPLLARKRDRLAPLDRVGWLAPFDQSPGFSSLSEALDCGVN